MSSRPVDGEMTLTINGVEVTAPMAEWNRVKFAVINRNIADDQAWEAQQRAAGQAWSVDLCSCGDGRGDWTEEYFTLDDLKDGLSSWADSDASILKVADAAGAQLPFDNYRGVLL